MRPVQLSSLLLGFALLLTWSLPVFAVEPRLKRYPELYGWSGSTAPDLTSAGDVTGSTVAFTNFINCGSITTDANGNFVCGSTPSGSGDITGVTAGTGLTGGGSSGEVTVNVGEGLAIDAAADSVALDPTELTGSRTWGDASTDTIIWTWDRATGTDPTLTMGDTTVTGQIVAASIGFEVNAERVTDWTGSGISIVGGALTSTGGSGDITDVGDCATGACFNGSSGTVLTFEGDAGADQTLTYDTTDDDFELNNDLTVIDASPHVQTCTTAQAKCYEMTSDGGALYFSDVTAGQLIAQMTPTTITWGRGAATSWTFNASSGTDNTLVFGDDQLIWGSPGQTDVTFYGGVGTNTPLLVVGGIGSILTTNSGVELQAQAGGGTDISIVAAGASATDGDFSANFSQGTLLSRTIVLDGDILGSLRFGGYDGTNYEECAFIDGRVDGEPGNNDMPEMLTFNTCADGTNTLTRRLTIRADGSMDFGNTGVKFAQDTDGQLELTGLSAGNDECLALNLDDTSNDAVFSNCAVSTGVTDVTFSSLDLDLEGTGPDIQWLVTGGDTLHLGCESTGCFLSNSTDGVHYFSTYSGDNHIVLGATGNVPSITLTTDGTGDAEVVLPTDSVGPGEVIGGLSKCASVENLAAADDNMPLGSMKPAVTVTAVWCHCYGTCSTPATIALEDDAGNAMTGTATCDTGGGAATPAAITAGGALVAYEGLRFDTTNAVSPETDEYSICFGF